MQHLRRDGHKGLHSCVLEHRKGDNEPERHRQVLDRPDVECSLLYSAGVPATARLVGDVVPRAEVTIEEEDGDGAGEREPGDERTYPEGPCVRAEVLGDDVCCGLAGEGGEVGYSPVNKRTRLESVAGDMRKID